MEVFSRSHLLRNFFPVLAEHRLVYNFFFPPLFFFPQKGGAFSKAAADAVSAASLLSRRRGCPGISQVEHQASSGIGSGAEPAVRPRGHYLLLQQRRRSKLPPWTWTSPRRVVQVVGHGTTGPPGMAQVASDGNLVGVVGEGVVTPPQWRSSTPRCYFYVDPEHSSASRDSPRPRESHLRPWSSNLDLVEP